MTHVHGWQATIAIGWRQCAECGLVERRMDGQWQEVSQTAEEMDWYGSEYAILNQSHSPSYVDDRKVEHDLPGYWSRP